MKTVIMRVFICVMCQAGRHGRCLQHDCRCPNPQCYGPGR